MGVSRCSHTIISQDAQEMWSAEVTREFNIIADGDCLVFLLDQETWDTLAPATDGRKCS